jgi:sortase A
LSTSPRIRNWSSIALCAVGIGLLAYAAWVMIEAHVFQDRLARRLEAAGSADSVSSVLQEASATRLEATASGLVGRFDIPRLGLSAMILEGVGDRALGRGIGHVPGTAFPGEPGNVGLAAHRDTYFRRLKDIAPGDRVHVRTLDGTFPYEVEWTRVVDPSRAELLHPTVRPSLTLVTCYPFHWVGNAPQRFVVRCRPLGAVPGAESPPENIAVAPARATRTPPTNSAPAEDLLDAGADSMDFRDEAITGESASAAGDLPPD